tara:strand:- start:1709 stop:2122 length:414 start_codon:yes stop_codon:yes gene_type:complete
MPPRIEGGPSLEKEAAAQETDKPKQSIELQSSDASKYEIGQQFDNGNVRGKVTGFDFENSKIIVDTSKLESEPIGKELKPGDELEINKMSGTGTKKVRIQEISPNGRTVKFEILNEKGESIGVEGGDMEMFKSRIVE